MIESPFRRLSRLSTIFPRPNQTLSLSLVPNRLVMFLEGSNGRGMSSASMDSLSSVRDVTYSCGSCGYSLNLSSSCRNTNNIGLKYRKIIKKGIVSFYSIDESRFSQTDELTCLPYFNSMNSWGFFRHRTKLRCRKCGSYIGIAYEESFPLPSLGSDYSDTNSGNGAKCSKKYMIRISSLQPSSEESGTAFITE